MVLHNQILWNDGLLNLHRRCGAGRCLCGGRRQAGGRPELLAGLERGDLPGCAEHLSQQHHQEQINRQVRPAPPCGEQQFHETATLQRWPASFWLSVYMQQLSLLLLYRGLAEHSSQHSTTIVTTIVIATLTMIPMVDESNVVQWITQVTLK